MHTYCRVHSATNEAGCQRIVGSAWLESAKIARKAGHWQTAYSAVLQAQQCKMAYSFMERTKLMKAGGEPLRALQDLENAMRMAGLLTSNSQTSDTTELPEVADKVDDRKWMEVKVCRHNSLKRKCSS